MAAGQLGEPAACCPTAGQCVEDPDTVFVVELWEYADSHRSALALPEVQEAIAAARPLLSGTFGRFRFEVVGSPPKD